MIEIISPLVVLSGLISGAIFGSFISTETEERVRPKRRKWTLFLNQNIVGIALNQILALAVIATTMTLAGLTILKLGSAYPLSVADRYTLGTSWFIGAGAAKWLRYRHWKCYA